MCFTKNIESLWLSYFNKPSFGLNVQNSDDLCLFQLWFYLPPSKLSSDNTVIYTVGLSRRYFESPCPWIELSFQAPGRHDRPQLEKLGMILGELVYDTLKVTHFTPNLLLTGLKRQFMPNMRDMLVIEGAGMRPLWIEMDDRIVRILQLLPLYQEEVPLIREMGFWNTYRRFIKQKINFLEPNRPKLTNRQFHPDDQQLAREVVINQGSPSKEKIWQDIQKWYRVNAPRIQAAQIEQPPAPSDNWEETFGLSKSFTDKASVAQTDEWLEQHGKRLYAGGFLPTQEKFLPVNPYFIT